MDTLFYNADIVTMRDENPVLRGCVAVRGGRIAYVGDREPEGEYRRVDCTGKILMPGLINAHTHIPMVILRGYADDLPLNDWLFNKIFPAEARIDRETVRAGAGLGIAELIRCGVTSVSDSYFFEPETAEAALNAGIRASLCNEVVAIGDYDPNTDRAIAETRALIRDYHNAGGGRIRADVGIHAEYTTSERAWELPVELQREYGLTMQVHLSETRREHEDCIARRNKTPARTLYESGVLNGRAVAAHCVWLSPEDMDIMAECGASAAHCPTSNMKLASGMADVPALTAHGVNVALGTDGCASNNTHDMFKEIKLASLMAKCRTGDPAALDAYGALKLATVNGAKAQGRDNIGSIAEGMDADMILIDTDAPSMRPIYDPISTLAYAATGERVYMTMVQGRVLYEAGEYKTLDIDKLLYEADKHRLV